MFKNQANRPSYNADNMGLLQTGWPDMNTIDLKKFSDL